MAAVPIERTVESAEYRSDDSILFRTLPEVIISGLPTIRQLAVR